MTDLFAFLSVVLYFALHTPVDFNNIHQLIYVIHLHFYAILFILSHFRNETMTVMILVFKMLDVNNFEIKIKSDFFGQAIQAILLLIPSNGAVHLNAIFLKYITNFWDSSVLGAKTISSPTFLKDVVL